MTNERATWGIITGEYPPQAGGVSGYTWVVAHALAAAGDDVHVFAPGVGLSEIESPVHVHRLNGGFSRHGRKELYAALQELPKPRRALLQFVLQSFGMRAVNLPFVQSLRRLHGFPLWIFFHEFAMADNKTESPLRRGHALATRVLARIAARSADVAFVSTPAWTPLVSEAAPDCPIHWLPIPSNIATQCEPAEVARLNVRFRSPEGGSIVGHFGTYRMRDSRQLLEKAIPALCHAMENRCALLLGRGSDAFAAKLIEQEPALASRIHGVGDLDSQALANHLTVCDILIQPYSDGATTRRGSLFAGLALGVPTVTTFGALSEDLWKTSNAALFAPPNDVAAIVALAEEALASTALREMLGSHARALYMCHFDIAHTVEALRRS